MSIQAQDIHLIMLGDGGGISITTWPLEQALRSFLHEGGGTEGRPPPTPRSLPQALAAPGRREGPWWGWQGSLGRRPSKAGVPEAFRNSLQAEGWSSTLLVTFSRMT